MIEIEGGNASFSWQIAEVRCGEEDCTEKGRGCLAPLPCFL